VVLSGSTLRCLVPPGAGTGIAVSIENRLGLRSAPSPLLSYELPSITSVSPSYALSAPSESVPIDVVIRGSSLASGDPRDPLPVVRVGGVTCGSVERTSSSLLVCRGLDASAWRSSNVEVTVAGQSVRASNVFTFTGVPQVLSVSLQRAL